MGVFSFLDPIKFRQLLHCLQEQSQVRVVDKAPKVLLSGSFLQVKKCNSLLQTVLCNKNLGDSISESDDTASTEKGGRGRAGSSGKPKRDVDHNNQMASQWNSTDERQINSTGRVDSNGSLLSAGAELGPTKDLELQTFEITPIMIRFVRKVYLSRIEIIEEEFSVKLIESDDHNKITIQPQSNCNEHKYNDACSGFIDLYQNAIQGVTKFDFPIDPDKNISKESVKKALRNIEETLPVLVEKGQDSWILFCDRDSVSAAKESIQKMLGIYSDKEKSRPRRAQATTQNRPTITDTSSSLSADDKNDVLTHTSKSGIKITVLKGDITEQHVDAIVISANTALDMKYGLGQTIISKGGSSIQDEAGRKGYVNPGNAVKTKAGRLPCKNIIHAVGPMDWPGKSVKKQQHILFKAYLESFKLATSSKLESIAVTSIGTGLVGVPLDVSACQLFNALEEFWGKKKEVKEIRIVTLEDEAHIVFKKEFEKRFKSNQSNSAKADGAAKGQASRADSAKPNSSESKTLGRLPPLTIVSSSLVKHELTILPFVFSFLKRNILLIKT